MVRNLDRLGVPRAAAMQWTGHKTEAVYRRYNIVSKRDLHMAGESLAKTSFNGAKEEGA